MTVVADVSHRHQGIGSELVAGFMDYVERDTAIADVSTDAKEFYDALDYEIINLEQFKFID